MFGTFRKVIHIYTVSKVSPYLKLITNGITIWQTSKNTLHLSTESAIYGLHTGNFWTPNRKWVCTAMISGTKSQSFSSFHCLIAIKRIYK